MIVVYAKAGYHFVNHQENMSTSRNKNGVPMATAFKMGLIPLARLNIRHIKKI